MRKLLSILLSVTMLMTCLVPAFTSVAADAPSIVVAENTEYYELADTVTVTFSLKNNPGIAALNVWVYSDSTELELKKSDEVWSAGAGFDSEDNNFGAVRNYDHKDCSKLFAEAGIENTGSIKAGSFELLTSDGNNSTENGVLLTVTFNLVGDHPAGTEYTYGMLIEYAEDENGEEIAFASNHVAGVATAVIDPYTEVFDKFTVFAVDEEVVEGQTEVTVALRWTNTVGINAFRVFVIYDDTLEVTKVTPTNDVFSVGDYEDGAKNEPTTEEGGNQSVLIAYKDFPDVPQEGKLVTTVFYAKKGTEENVYKDGVLAYLTFKLPEGAAVGEQFPIDLIYTAKDFVHLDEVEKDDDGNAKMVFQRPDTPTGYITVVAEEPECDHHDLTPVEEVAPECEKDGNIAYYICNDCGMYFRDDAATEEIDPADVVIKATGHKALVEVSAVAPTCDDDGIIKHYKCEDCGKLFADETAAKELTEDQIVDPATDHDWVETDRTPATCTENGKIVYTCKNNPEHTREEVLEATGHQSLVEVPAVPATCEDDGVFAHYKCEDCGRLFTDETAEEELDPEEVIDKSTGHSLVLVEEKAETCTEDGNIAHYKCENCDKLFSAEDQTKEISEEEVVIPAKGHSWGDNWEVIEEATEDHDGKERRYCEHGCGEYEERPIDRIRDYIPGDVNRDGVVDGRDAVLLMQYLSGWDVEIDLKAADVDDDGEVTALDMNLLMQYLADWDVAFKN